MRSECTYEDLQWLAQIACEVNELDDAWHQKVIDLVSGTNAAMGQSDGYCEEVCEDYSHTMASKISLVLDNGDDPNDMSFMDLYNYQGSTEWR